MSYSAILLNILCVIILSVVPQTNGCGISPGLCPSIGCTSNCLAFYTNIESSSCPCPLYPPRPSLSSRYMNGESLFMPIVEREIHKNCSLRCNQLENVLTLNEAYEFIIVGSGAGGSLLAYRLVSAGFSVIVIETGDKAPIATRIPSEFHSYVGSSIDWNFVSQPQNNACLKNPCTIHAGKVLGGSTTINGMLYVRGNPVDYNNWNITGWSYPELLPLFKKTEKNQDPNADSNYHGFNGPLPVGGFNYVPEIVRDVCSAAQELNYPITDLNGASQTGFTIAQCTTKGGVRESAQNAFLDPFAGKSNPHLLLNATVTKVIFELGRAVGVLAQFRNGTTIRINALKEVILSSGAINTPKILIHSGVGPSATLNRLGIDVVADLPGVGQNLQNHVIYYLPLTSTVPNRPPLTCDALREFLDNSGGMMSTVGLPNVIAKISSPLTDANVPDLQLLFGGCTADFSSTGLCCDPSSIGNRKFQILSHVLNHPSVGHLEVVTTNSFDDPLIYGNYLSDPNHISVIMHGITVSKQLIGTQAMQKYGLAIDRSQITGCDQYVLDSYDYWKCDISNRATSENHPAGTCKMGNDSMSVVNPDLEVFRVTNLRIVDASVMPTLPAANPMATVYVIAEKAAAAIIRKYT